MDLPDADSYLTRYSQTTSVKTSLSQNAPDIIINIINM